MEFVNSRKKYSMLTKVKSFRELYQSFEVVVIEDNKLINLILSNALRSTINKIRELRNSNNYSIKLSKFYSGTDFLSYLKGREFGKTKLIVFSDYHLENKMTGAKILKKLRKKGIDTTVVILSDTTNKQTSIDTVKMGAYCFLPKDMETPLVCSQMLTQMVN